MSKTTEQQSSESVAQNFEQTPLVLDMNKGMLSKYQFGVNVAVTLRSIELLEDQLGDKSSIFHLTGKASRTSSRELEEEDLQVLNGNTGKISYHMKNGNEIKVSIEEWNPYNVSSTFTAEKARNVIEDHAGFEDLSLDRLGVMEEVSDDVASQLGISPDTKVYHGMENVTPVSIVSNSFSPTANIQAVMDAMGVHPDHFASIGSRTRSVLFTDFILLGNGMNHVDLQSNGVLQDVVSGLVNRKNWLMSAQTVSNYPEYDSPVYQVNGKNISFLHNRE